MKGTPPDPQFSPSELSKRVGTVKMFTAVTAANLGRPDPNLDLPVILGGTMSKYDWTINGEPYSRTNPLHVREGQHPTLIFDNATMMYHPMHLHGHSFRVLPQAGVDVPQRAVARDDVVDAGDPAGPPVHRRHRGQVPADLMLDVPVGDAGRPLPGLDVEHEVSGVQLSTTRCPG